MIRGYEDRGRDGTSLRAPMVRQERAVMVGLQRRSENSGPVLEELGRLAESADAVVVGTLIQRRAASHPATFIGMGKVNELQRLCEAQHVDLVIFDAELTPAQQRNLERHLGLTVIDRTALVLDIFAQRARTREGRLQVELAQMIYLLPRLTGRGVVLSRLGGGIGTRGPGETKLEVDRRRIRSRVTILQREISEIGRRRTLQRQARRQAQLPVVALVGYTNAGKSSLLNALTDAGVSVQDKLFATLDPTVRKVILPNRRPVLLVDTVGFITNLPPQLIAAFRATLEEVTEADLLVHVIDASHPAWRSQVTAVETVLEELGAGEKPTLYAVNKSDRLAPGQLKAIVAEFDGNAVGISALQGVGLINLLRSVSLKLPEPMVRVKLKVPYTRLRALSEIFARGRVLHEEYGDHGVSVEAELTRAQTDRIQSLLRVEIAGERPAAGTLPPRV